MFRANLLVLRQPGARKGVVRMIYPQFRYAFVNVLSEARPRRGRRNEPLQFQKVRAVQGTDRFQSVPWPLPLDHRAGRLARGRQRHGPLAGGGDPLDFREVLVHDPIRRNHAFLKFSTMMATT